MRISGFIDALTSANDYHDINIISFYTDTLKDEYGTDEQPLFECDIIERNKTDCDEYSAGTQEEMDEVKERIYACVIRNQRFVMIDNIEKQVLTNIRNSPPLAQLVHNLTDYQIQEMEDNPTQDRINQLLPRLTFLPIRPSSPWHKLCRVS